MFTVTTECGGRTAVDPGPARRADPPVELVSLVPGREELAAMAEGLAMNALQWPGLAGITRRRWELLAASDAFEAWVIGWPPGGIIALHDHGHSSAAVVVAGGELVETLVTEQFDGSVTTTSRRMAAGTSWSMDSDHVHDVVNDSSSPAVSVHVYAPRLTSMTSYTIDGGVLTAEKTVHYRLGDVVP
jgi:quercetin dioxygenase-like cupin family protein